MAMKIGAYEGYYATERADSARERDKKTEIVNNGKTEAVRKPTQLSQKAQIMLEKLKQKYGNMDFMVADLKDGVDASGSTAGEILSRGTKEFSVLFSSEELEKMAADENYAQEYMNKIEGAVRMSERICEQNGFTRGFGTDIGEGSLTKVGVSFNSDGSVTYFAELEKANAKQTERIEKTLKKRSEERREAVRKREAKTADRKEGGVARETTGTKKATIQAESEEELLAKLRTFDWNRVKEEQKTEGDRFDFSV